MLKVKSKRKTNLKTTPSTPVPRHRDFNFNFFTSPLDDVFTQTKLKTDFVQHINIQKCRCTSMYLCTRENEAFVTD